MLDGLVEQKWIDFYALHLDRIPEEGKKHFFEHYGRDKSEEFYLGMLKQALNDLELIGEIGNMFIKEEDSKDYRKYAVAIGSHAETLLHSIIYISHIIKEKQRGVM